LTIARTAFERVYSAQNDVRIKERMLLVLNVAFYGEVAANVAREIHKVKGWACQWLKRCKKKDWRTDQKAGDIRRYPDKQYAGQKLFCRKETIRAGKQRSRLKG
jgi:hypothetical protein